jgi:WD40 repeat protein
MRGVNEATFAPAWRQKLEDYPSALAVSRDGAALAVGLGSGAVIVIDVATGVIRERRDAHNGAVLAVDWNPRSHALLSAGEEGALLAYRQGAAIVLHTPGGGWVEHARWSPRGNRLASAHGRHVMLWADDGRQIARTPPLESTVAGLTWAPDGKRVGAACYGGVRLVDPLDGVIRETFDWKASMLGFEWSPDGRLIACGCQDGTVHFWRVATGKDAQMSGYPLKPSAIAWSHDSKMLATSGAPTITIWPFDGKGPEGRSPLELEAHDAPITALQFSPLVRFLASGCRAGEVAVWAPGGAADPMSRHHLDGKVVAVTWAASAATNRQTLIAAAESGELLTLAV